MYTDIYVYIYICTSHLCEVLLDVSATRGRDHLRRQRRRRLARRLGLQLGLSVVEAQRHARRLDLGAALVANVRIARADQLERELVKLTQKGETEIDGMCICKQTTRDYKCICFCLCIRMDLHSIFLIRIS